MRVIRAITKFLFVKERSATSPSSQKLRATNEFNAAELFTTNSIFFVQVS
jgi:hypothetical protein